MRTPSVPSVIKLFTPVTNELLELGNILPLAGLSNLALGQFPTLELR